MSFSMTARTSGSCTIAVGGVNGGTLNSVNTWTGNITSGAGTTVTLTASNSSTYSVDNVSVMGKASGQNTSTLGGSLDTAPPTMTGIVANPGNEIDVTFSEPMLGSSATTLTNYTLSGTGMGTLAANPTSVVGTGPYTLGWSSGEMRGGQTVGVSAPGVQDVAGNVITTPNSGSCASLGTAPSAFSVTQAGGQNDPTKGSTINFAVTFDEKVKDFTDSDVDFTGSTAGGTLVATVTPPNNPSGSTDFNVAVTGMASTGTVVVSVPSNVCTDLAGNLNGASTNVDNVVTYDIDPPTVSNVTSLHADGSFKAGEDIDIQVVFSELVNVAGGPPTLTLETGTPDRVASLSGGSGTNTLVFSYTVQAGDTSSDLDYVGTGALALNGGAIQDAVLTDATLALAAPGDEESLGFNKDIEIDTTAPTVEISAPSPSVTKNGPVTYTVTYGGADSVTLANGNVTLNTTGDATGTADVTGSGNTTRTVTIDPTTGTGTLGITIASGTASDNAGNTAPGAGPSTTFNVDNTAPTVAVNALGTVNDTTPLLTGTVDDNLAVAGVQVTVGGHTYAANVAGTSWDAQVTFALTGLPPTDYTVSATATDTAGNTAMGSAPLRVDTSAPTTVMGVLMSGASPTNAGSVQFDVVFSLGVNPVAVADFALHVTGGITGQSITGVAGSGYTRTVTVNTGSGDGTLRLDVVDRGTIFDTNGDQLGGPGAGNGNYSSGQVYTIDKTRPGVSLTSTTPNPTNSSSIPVVVTFTEDVLEFVEEDVAVSNATKTDWAKISDQEYHINLNPIADGEVTADIAADVAHDEAGNGNTAASQLSWTRDTVRPTVSIGAPTPAATSEGPVEYLVTYNDVDVVTLASGNVHLIATGDATGEIIVSGGKAGEMTRTITIVNITGEDGTLAITIDAGTGCDAAGNCDLGPSGGESEAFTVTPGVPVASALSLGLLAVGCALTGLRAIKRKK